MRIDPHPKMTAAEFAEDMRRLLADPRRLPPISDLSIIVPPFPLDRPGVRRVMVRTKVRDHWTWFGPVPTAIYEIDTDTDEVRCILRSGSPVPSEREALLRGWGAGGSPKSWGEEIARTAGGSMYPPEESRS